MEKVWSLGEVTSGSAVLKQVRALGGVSSKMAV